MKKSSYTSKVYIELVFTVFVAFLLSAVLAIVLVYLVGQFGTLTNEASVWVNTVSSITAGFVVGYRFNTILAPHTKSKRKK